MREGLDQLPASGGAPIDPALSHALSGPRINRQNMACDFAPALGWKARIGMIVLATDHTIEFEWRQIMDAAARLHGSSDAIALYAARILNVPSITPESLRDMESRIALTADLLLPGMPFDVIAYGCTSASMLIGTDRVRARVHETRPGVAVTDPVTAACAAFEALGVQRLAMLTPYIAPINDQLRRGFMTRGIDIPVMGSFNVEDDNLAARASSQSLINAAMELGSDSQVDGVFISCTSIRLTDTVSELEAALGKPVLSSNLAMAWHTLRLAGITDPVPGFGRLFQGA